MIITDFEILLSKVLEKLNDVDSFFLLTLKKY